MKRSFAIIRWVRKSVVRTQNRQAFSFEKKNLGKRKYFIKKKLGKQVPLAEIRGEVRFKKISNRIVVNDKLFSKWKD